MMRFGSRHIQYDLGPNLTPLVDVVLVVLIFLMLAGSFGGVTHFLLSTAPRTGHTAAAPPLTQLPTPPLDLYLTNFSPGIGVQGIGIGMIGDLAVLTDRLRLQSDAYARAGIAPSGVQVVIHAKPNVRYRQLLAVYDAALRANFTSVGFATNKLSVTTH